MGFDEVRSDQGKLTGCFGIGVLRPVRYVSRCSEHTVTIESDSKEDAAASSTGVRKSESDFQAGERGVKIVPHVKVTPFVPSNVTLAARVVHTKLALAYRIHARLELRTCQLGYPGGAVGKGADGGQGGCDLGRVRGAVHRSQSRRQHLRK